MTQEGERNRENDEVVLGALTQQDADTMMDEDF